MNSLNSNIERMIASYPTSYRNLNESTEIIQKEVSAIIDAEFTDVWKETLKDQLENHDNDYFVKAFRKEYTLEQAAEAPLGEVIHFAVKVCASVVQ